MTLFHFANCAALAFAPYFISYKYSGLSEYCSIWKCGQAAIVYLLTQLGKLLLLATFFPTSDKDGFDMVPELMKSSADVLDLIGLHVLISYGLAGRGEVRFLAAGLGWAASDAVASRLIPLWVGARAPGFHWRHMQMALDSNLQLFIIVSVAALVWLRARNDLPRQMKSLANVLLLFAVFEQFFYQLLFHYALIRSWSLLLAKTVCTGAMVFATLLVYSTLRTSNTNAR